MNAVGSRRMRDVAKWLYERFAANTVELIHTTPYNTDRGFYVKNQRKYPGGGPYDPQTRAQHRNHVHFATSKALAQKILAGLGKREALAQTAAPVWGVGCQRPRLETRADGPESGQEGWDLVLHP